jgi:P2-related tail formation protein
MSLLPNNSSLIDQQIAEMFAAESQESYKSLKIDPLTCHASILEHLALEYGIDISILNEALARTFLSNSIKNRPVLGTVQAVESLLELFFENGKLVEWFDDEKNLEVGEFSFLFPVDNNLIYGEDLFLKFLKLLKKYKNVRSLFHSFNLKLSEQKQSFYLSSDAMLRSSFSREFKIDNTGEVEFNLIKPIGLLNINLSSEVKDKDFSTKFNLIKPIGLLNINLSSEVKDKDFSTKFNLIGGVLWRV